MDAPNSAGNLSGKIALDVSDFGLAVQAMNSAARSMEQSSQAITASLQRVEKETQQMAQDVEQAVKSVDSLGMRFKSAFDGIKADAMGFLQGAAWQGFIQGGLQAAQQVKNVDAMFVIMSGSQEKANANMAALEKLAAKTGEPITRLKEGATSLLPIVKNTNADLGQLFSVAQRLGTLDPMQGTAGAAFALREFMNGEYMSLVRRFELPRQTLMKIRDEAKGDSQKMVEGLAKVIDSMGLTQEKAAAMGQSGKYAFEKLNDEVMRLQAVAFRPLLDNVVLPLVKGFADLVSMVRQLNPELTGIIGKVGGLSALGQAVNRLPFGIGDKISSNIGVQRGMGAAIGITGGIELGTGLVRGAGELGVGGFEQFKGKSQDEAKNIIGETLKQVGVILLDGFFEVAKVIISEGVIVGKVINHFGAIITAGAAELQKVFGQMTAIFGKIIADVAEKLSFLPGMDKVKSAGQVMKAAGEAQTTTAAATAAAARERIDQTRNMGLSFDEARLIQDEIDRAKKQRIDEFMGSTGLSKPEDTKTIGEGSRGGGGADTGPITEEQKKFVEENIKLDKEQAKAEAKAKADSIIATNEMVVRQAQIETERTEKIKQIDQEFKERTVEINANRAKQIKDLAEQEAEYVQQRDEKRRDQLDQISEQANERERDAYKGFEEKKGKDRENLQKAEKSDTERFNKQMAQLEKQRRETILQAAANLDARAVWQAQRQFALQKGQAEEQQRDTNADRRKQMAESHEQEKKDIETRLAQGREQDEKRRADLTKQWAKEDKAHDQQRDKQMKKLHEQWADEDKAREKDRKKQYDAARKAADKELEAMIVANAKKQAEINKALENEKNAILTKRSEALIALQKHEAAMNKVQDEGQAAMLRSQYEFYRKMALGAADVARHDTTPPPPTAGESNPVTALATRVTDIAQSVGGGVLGSLANVATNLWSAFTGGATNTRTSTAATSRRYATGTMWAAGGGSVDEGEIVLNPNISATVRAMLGTGATQQHVAAAVAAGARGGSGGGSGGLNIENFSPKVEINGSGLSEDALARAVQEGLENSLMAVAQKLQTQRAS